MLFIVCSCCVIAKFEKKVKRKINERELKNSQVHNECAALQCRLKHVEVLGKILLGCCHAFSSNKQH